MNATRKMLRLTAAGLLAGGVAVAGVGLSPGIAHANKGPFTWCPGQSMEWPSGPNSSRGVAQTYVWDMNVCHTWYIVADGWGNVPRVALNGQQTLQSSHTWDGNNPPPDNPSGVNCGPGWCPVPPHYDPGFHG